MLWVEGSWPFCWLGYPGRCPPPWRKDRDSIRTGNARVTPITHPRQLVPTGQGHQNELAPSRRGSTTTCLSARLGFGNARCHCRRLSTGSACRVQGLEDGLGERDEMGSGEPCGAPGSRTATLSPEPLTTERVRRRAAAELAHASPRPTPLMSPGRPRDCDIRPPQGGSLMRSRLVGSGERAQWEAPLRDGRPRRRSPRAGGKRR